MTETELEPSTLTASIIGVSTWKQFPTLALYNVADCLGEDSIKWKVLNRTTNSSTILDEATQRVLESSIQRSQAFRKLERLERIKHDLKTLRLSHLFPKLYAITRMYRYKHESLEYVVRKMAQNARKYPLDDDDAEMNSIYRGSVLLELFRETPCQSSYFFNEPVSKRDDNESILYGFIGLIYLEWNRRDPKVRDEDMSLYVDQLTGNRSTYGRANKRKYRIVDYAAAGSIYAGTDARTRKQRKLVRKLGLEESVTILKRHFQ